LTANGEGGITQGATENIFSVSNATSWSRGAHNLRFGLQAQYRRYEQLTEVPPRGGFTFNGQFTGNQVADFLLGYCSTCTGAFGSSRSLYTSPTIAPFIDDNWQVSSKLTLQMGLRWEYLGPWHEQNNQEGSFVGGVDWQRRPVESAGPTGPAHHQPEWILSAGHPQEGSEQLGSACRCGLHGE
jgi:hypothetical protein